ncbi:hypothetical protein DIPPA_02010 [Diplonema papillatum]|nr:hypothetical protein DIPPA_02010 [Diplonema papillatum]
MQRAVVCCCRRGIACSLTRRAFATQGASGQARLASAAPNAGAGAPGEAGKGLAWTDEEAAAHLHTVVLPEMRANRLAGDAAVDHLTAELAKLRKYGCFVWNTSWAVAIGYFARAPPSRGKGKGKGRRRESSAQKDARQESAQKLFDRCVSAGVEPNCFVYAKLLQAQRSYQNCRVTFDFMVLDGTAPDEDSVLSVLNVCQQYPKTARHKAESLMSFLEHEGIESTPAIWDKFLSIYAEAGDLPGASDVFLRMKAAGLPLSPSSYTWFLTACANSPSTNDTFEIAEQAVTQCHREETVLSAAGLAKLMHVYAVHGALRRGKLLYRTVAKAAEPPASELLWHYSKLLRRSADSKDRVNARILRRVVRKRYMQTLRKVDEGRYRRLLAARTRHTKQRAGKSPARKGRPHRRRSDIDLIGEAIKRHLGKKETESANKTVLAAPRVLDASPKLRPVDKLKTARHANRRAGKSPARKGRLHRRKSDGLIDEAMKRHFGKKETESANNAVLAAPRVLDASPKLRPVDKLKTVRVM